MNCFQNCIFTWHSQLMILLYYLLLSCELLSELYFYLAFAVKEVTYLCPFRLWIAFRIVFLLGIRSFRAVVPRPRSVVNCFQNCIFTWHSQSIIDGLKVELCCELLSELYFYLAFAVKTTGPYFRAALWIALAPLNLVANALSLS